MNFLKHPSFLNLHNSCFRLLWCIAFLFTCYYGYLLYTPFLDTWNYEPTVIDIDQADFPVDKIPFPAVTICSNNKIVYRQLESVLWSKQPWKGLLAYNYNITQETDEGRAVSLDEKDHTNKPNQGTKYAVKSWAFT